MKREIIFDIEKWHHELLELWSNYFRFYDFINQEDLYLKYIGLYDPFTLGFSEIYYKKENNEELNDWELNLIANLQKQRDNIINTFSRLMIVGISSIMEFMIEEYFQILFNYKPHKMIEYNFKKNKNKIPVSIISELLKHESIKEFIMDLSDKNADNASHGKKDKVLKTLKDLSEFNFNDRLFKNMKEIWEKRNIIVHENNKDIIELGFVLYSIKTAHLFLISLALCAKKMEIPYNCPEHLEDRIDDFYSNKHSLEQEINELKELSYDEYLSKMKDIDPFKLKITLIAFAPVNML